jgi:NDP-sugar pyrophosphorylase family protein
MAKLSPVAILAGGRGTRLGGAVAVLPKVLVEVAGEPFLFHQLRLLRRQGAHRIVICTGHRGAQVVEAVGDGARFDLEVEYSDDGEELIGTGSALRKALPKLGDVFHVLYGDTYLQLDFAGVEEAFGSCGNPALMTVLRNNNNFARSNAVYADGQVLVYDKEQPTADMHWIDYGLSVMTPAALAFPGADLAGVQRELARNSLLAGYEVAQRFYHVGDPDAWRETDAYLRHA